MRKNILLTTVLLFATTNGAYSLFAEEKPDAAATQNAVSAVMSDPYKARLMEIKVTRDKFIAGINEVENKIEARKIAIGAENPEVGKLAAEIEELAKKINETNAILEAKYAQDEELQELKKKSVEVRKEYSDALAKVNADASAGAKARKEADEKAADEESSDSSETAETADAE